MNNQTQDSDLQDIGKSAYESIADMVAALECDYDRLEELKEERDDWLSENPGKFLEPNDPRDAGRWSLAFPDESEELSELIDQAGECESREDAEQRIQEDPLSIEVRSGWYTPGKTDNKPAEFMILLTTGGPAVRIMGELDEYGQPDRAWLEAQDWFKPWTQYLGADQSVLLTYCQQFYFRG